MTDPTVENFLRVRRWAAQHRRDLERQAEEARNLLVASRAGPGRITTEQGAVIEKLRRAGDVAAGGLAEVSQTIDLLDRARVVSFPDLSPDVFDLATTAAGSIPGLPDPFDRLPFQVTYFGFGRGVDMGKTPYDSLAAQGLVATGSVGVLASRDGTIVLVSGFGRSPMVWSEVFAAPVYEDGECEVKDVQVGWLLHLLLEVVRAAPPVRYAPDLGLSARRERERATRLGASQAPTEYYRVPITGVRARAIFADVERESQQPAWSHRWDVRRHRASRFLRGEGDVPAETALRLMERGYEVYFAPDPELDRELSARGMPVQGPNEWVARKSWDVSEHVRGPEDKPYVPARRVVTTGHGSVR